MLPFNEFSDHAPLFYSFVCTDSNHNSFNTETDSVTEEKIVWDPAKETLFLNKLRENQEILLTNENSDVPINEKVTAFSSLLAETSMNVFGKTIKTLPSSMPA